MSESKPNGDTLWSQGETMFRRAFSMWERTTAATFDQLVRNPMWLQANAAWLNGALAAKKIADDSVRTMLTSFGLPSRRDQERTLHMLQQIDGRLDDLQLELDEQRRAASAQPAQPTPDAG